MILSRPDKVRIIALYILYKDGVPDEDRRRLFQHAKLSVPEQDAVNNLVHLGVRVVKVRPMRHPLICAGCVIDEMRILRRFTYVSSV